MKPFVFNKDSWHYWLANEVGNFKGHIEETDICTYTRAVINGAFWATVAAAVMCGLVYWITITLVWWVVILQHGFFEAVGPVVLTAILVIFGGSALVAEGVPWLFRKIRRAVYDSQSGRREKVKVKTDNFVAQAYRSWKEKTCVRVTLIGDASND